MFSGVDGVGFCILGCSGAFVDVEIGCFFGVCVVVFILVIFCKCFVLLIFLLFFLYIK